MNFFIEGVRVRLRVPCTAVNALGEETVLPQGSTGRIKWLEPCAGPARYAVHVDMSESDPHGAQLIFDARTLNQIEVIKE